MAKSDVDRGRELLRGAVEKAKRSSVGFPVAFVRSATNGAATPPLAELLRGPEQARGGRSGDVRLKLYLTLVMRATAEPYDLAGVPASAYALMLGVAKPDSDGARRITTALRWLDEHDFVDLVAPVQGKPADLKVLHPAGPRTGGTRYVSVPIDFWTNAWIVHLPGRAVALFLILRELTGGSPAGWEHAPGWRKEQYGLSSDTWTRATRDLVEAGLLETRRRIDRADMSQARTRTQYRLLVDRLAANPPSKTRPRTSRHRTSSS